jgi:hypothetical protein
MIVSILSYREITGDSETASAEVERVLLESQALLEDDLERGLEQVSRTETLRIIPHDVTGVSMVFPSVTPIITVDGGFQHQDGVVYGALPVSIASFDVFSTPPQVATVTYLAGFDPDETDTQQPDYVPRYIRYDIAWAAWQLLQPSQVAASQIPAGAISVKSGDQAVTFKDPIRPGDLGISWSRQTLRWKRRHP